MHNLINNLRHKNIKKYLDKNDLKDDPQANYLSESYAAHDQLALFLLSLSLFVWYRIPAYSKQTVLCAIQFA